MEDREMKSVLASVLVMLFLMLLAACDSKTGTDKSVLPGKTIKTVAVGSLTVKLSNDSGVLKHGKQELILSVTDASGKPSDVGAVSLNFYMPQMGSMKAMNDAVTFTTTSTPGTYRGKVDLEVAAEWQRQLSYEGPPVKSPAPLIR